MNPESQTPLAPIKPIETQTEVVIGPMESPKAKNNILLTILLLAFIFPAVTYLSYFIYGKYYVKPTKKLTTANVPIVTNMPVVTNSPAALFIKYEIASGSGKLIGYDFNTRKTFTPQLPSGQGSDFLPALSSWSPSGQYLLMKGVRDNTLPQPLFLYNNKSRSISYLLDTNKFPDLMYSDSSFVFASKWLNDQYFAYDVVGSLPSTNSATRPVITVDTSGKVGKSTEPNSVIFHNNRLSITHSLQDLEKPQSITLDGKRLSALDGDVIGVTPKYIVTIKKPKLVNIIELEQNKELSAQIVQTKDPSDVVALMDKASNVSAGSSILLYPIDKPNSNSVVTWPYNEWVVVEAQTLPSKDTIILHEQNSLFKPAKSRFTMLNIDDPTNPKVIAETKALNTAEASMVGLSGFNITQDYKWLVIQSGDIVQGTGEITAWNLTSGEKIEICSVNCGSLRVYNPNNISSR